MTSMEPPAEFRSDTFTMPNEGMRKAIYDAEVGNSGYGEDPSINKLEETIAEFFGCEKAVFLPSATMAGQIAISVWARPGDMVIIEKFGHSYYFETGPWLPLPVRKLICLRAIVVFYVHMILPKE